MSLFTRIKKALSKKTAWFTVVVLLVLVLIFTSSSIQIVVDALKPPALPELQVSTEKEPIWLSSWSPDVANKYHHINQGTRTFPMPYKWFVNLERPRSFLPAVLAGSEELLVDDEYLLRFGFIKGEKSADNPDGLPVGFAKTPLQNLKGLTEKTDAIGFTCAACHTGHLVFDDQEYIIEGGPATTDVGLLIESITAALGQTALSSKIPVFNGRFDRFAKRVLEEEYSPANRRQLEEEVASLIGALSTNGGDIIHVAEGFTRMDALNRIGNEVFSYFLDRRENYAPIDAPVNYPHIWTASWFDWVQYDGSIMGPLIRNAGEALGVSAYLDTSSPIDQNRFASSIPMKNLVWLEQQLAGEPPFPNKKFTGLQSPRWPEAFPQPESEKVELGAALYSKYCSGCHLPALDTPDIWTEQYFQPIKYRKNGQTYETSEKTLKLKIIELDDIGTDRAQSNVLAHRTVNTSGIANSIAEASLPGVGVNADVCTPDANADAYMDTWEASQTAYPVEAASYYNLPDADAEHYKKYELMPLAYNTVSDGSTIGYGAALAAVVQQTIDAWYKQNNISDPALKDRFEEGRPNCIQAGAGYKARPLNGVWATAPFLHNGSVPTLMAMLSPDDRPTYVRLGNIEFDAENVGLKQPANYAERAQKHLAKGELYDDDGFFILDTTQPGNGNHGHEFRETYDENANFWEQPPGVIGPEFTQEQKEAIIAYLKTL